jgi:hypothetical protein
MSSFAILPDKFKSSARTAFKLRHNPHLDAGQRRFIAMLADAGPRGITETALLANGFTAQLLAELERDGLITASIDKVRAGGKTIEVKRFRITDIGTKAIR